MSTNDFMTRLTSYLSANQRFFRPAYRSENFWLWRNSHVTVRASIRPSAPTLREGEGKSRGAFGQPAFFLAGNRMTIVAFEEGLSFFNKTIVREYWSFILDKKTSNIYKWKEKVQKNTGRRRKVQVTKAAFKGLHHFVFFTAESLPCSET